MNVNLRRIVYFTLLALAVLLVFQGLSQNQEKVLLPPDPLGREQVMDQFKNGFPVQADGTVLVKAVVFSQNYEGKPGDAFYVEAEYNGELTTVWYVIQAPASEGEKVYYLEKNRWVGVQLPAERFDRYVLEKQRWVREGTR